MNRENDTKKDIFDRLFETKLFKPFEKIYKANKEVLLYLFFGVLTTALNYAVFAICSFIIHFDASVFGMRLDTTINNVIAWIAGVAFAFVTNRIWVFDSKVETKEGLVKECLAFCSGRLATLIIETLILLVFSDMLGFNIYIVKLVANVVVIVLNYIISKFFVFKKDKEQ